MVKLTVDLVVRNTGQVKRRRDESSQHFARRLTHAYCNEKNINEIENIASCRSLSVLYLYDNQITNIAKLSNLYNLTHLYLQNNNISKLENLHSLKKLTKLYLGGNMITVLEGLEKLSNVTELHIENQRLSLGEKLLFDPRTVETLRKSLHVLDISGNKLDNISELCNFENLIQFSAANNSITDFAIVKRTLATWPSITNVTLNGNPISHKTKYLDRMLVVCPESVVIIDGKDVNETAREFLLKMHMKRLRQRSNNKKNSKLTTLPSQQQQNDLTFISPEYLNTAVPLPVPNIKLARAAAFRQVEMISKATAAHPQRLPDLNLHRAPINVRHGASFRQRKVKSNLITSQPPSKQLMMMTAGGVDLFGTY